MPKVIFTPEEQKYIADSEYLSKEVRRLEAEKSKLIQETNSLAKKNSNLVEQQIILEKKAQDTIANADSEANRIINLAQEKLNKANQKDAQATGYLSELKEKIKDAENLKKSNEGLQKNLNIQIEEFKQKSVKLNNLADSIIEIVKDYK